MGEEKNNTQNFLVSGKRWKHIWGFDDTAFELVDNHRVRITGSRYPISGQILSRFLPFVEEVLDISLNLDSPREELGNKPIPSPVLNKGFFTDVQKTFPENLYTLDDEERLLHSHGQTTADEVIKVLYEKINRVADMVFFCEDEFQLTNLVEMAHKHKVCLVPYGGGTNVSNALQLPVNESRMIVVIDMRRMNLIEWVDAENLRACIQAGITGIDLERGLREQGFTMGHEPDSIELSTLGGWIATNASGMKKNRYGNIEDIVEGMRILTVNGIVEHKMSMPRHSIGIQPQQLFIGSEGNLGIITKAIVRIRRVPEQKAYDSAVFPDFSTGVRFLYELSQQDLLPASIRLVDNFQFRFGSVLQPDPSWGKRISDRVKYFFLAKIKGFDFKKIVAATMVYEGSKQEVKSQKKMVKEMVGTHGGLVAGSENGERGYLLTYLIAYIRDFLDKFYILGETYETTVPWGRITEVCDAVSQEAEHQHKLFNLPGKPYISPRITQLYRTGVCVYFTHGFYTAGVNNAEDIFSQIEKELRRTIMDHGGALSHHHGVGKLRSSFMDRVLSDSAIALIQTVKHSLDPKNIFGISNNLFHRP